MSIKYDKKSSASITKICKNCGASFVPTRYAKKFCTKFCCDFYYKNGEYQRKYYEKYKDRYIKNSKRYYEKNKKKCKVQMREYYEKNKEKINKNRKKRSKKTFKIRFPQICELYARLLNDQKAYLYNKKKLKKALLIYESLIEKLDLPKKHRLKYEYFSNYYKIWRRIEKGKGIRNPLKLTSAVMYLFFRSKGIPLNRKDLLLHTGVNNNKFKEDLKYALTFYPAFGKRNRELIIQNYIVNVKKQFNLPDQFVEDAYLLRTKLWPYIKDSNENLIAGVLCSLLVVALDFKEIQIQDICNYLGTTSGSVINKVRKRIFRHINMGNFQGLRSSSKLVKNLTFNIIGINKYEIL